MQWLTGVAPTDSLALLRSFVTPSETLGWWTRRSRCTPALDTLIGLAHDRESPKVRGTALFWLGQSKDPRALKFFEEILR